MYCTTAAVIVLNSSGRDARSGAEYSINDGCSYNLTGVIVPNERAAVFKISSLALIEPNMGESYARLAERLKS